MTRNDDVKYEVMVSNSWLAYNVSSIEIYTGVQEAIWSIALNTWILILHVLCRVMAANRRE